MEHRKERSRGDEIMRFMRLAVYGYDDGYGIMTDFIRLYVSFLTTLSNDTGVMTLYIYRSLHKSYLMRCVSSALSKLRHPQPHPPIPPSLPPHPSSSSPTSSSFSPPSHFYHHPTTILNSPLPIPKNRLHNKIIRRPNPHKHRPQQPNHPPRTPPPLITKHPTQHEHRPQHRQPRHHKHKPPHPLPHRRYRIRLQLIQVPPILIRQPMFLRPRNQQIQIPPRSLRVPGIWTAV